MRQSMPSRSSTSSALSGKKVGFEKSITPFDEFIASLKAEQIADDEKQEYCAVEFDTADDKNKELEHAIAGLEPSIAKLTIALPHPTRPPRPGLLSHRPVRADRTRPPRTAPVTSHTRPPLQQQQFSPLSG